MLWDNPTATAISYARNQQPIARVAIHLAIVFGFFDLRAKTISKTATQFFQYRTGQCCVGFQLGAGPQGGRGKVAGLGA